MNIESPEVRYIYNVGEDRAMREIIEAYKRCMDLRESSKENLYLKKLRLHHPWFRMMSFNSFKMVFDQGQLEEIKWGKKLYKQDARITDVYLVLSGKVSLNYIKEDKEVETFKEGGFLGFTLGEELLFYKDPLYRETAICESKSCCVLRLNARDLISLGDQEFLRRNLDTERLRNDMDMMFEHIGHIYNKKERWRIQIAHRELENAQEPETEYT